MSRGEFRIGYDIIAEFPCNSGGVRVGTIDNPRGNASRERARRVALAFSKLNKVETYTRLRLVRNKTFRSRYGR